MTHLLLHLALISTLASGFGAGDGQVHANALRDALRLREQGRADDAGIALERLARQRNLPAALAARTQNALGLVRRDQGRWPEAVAHFEAGLEAVPPNTTDCALRPTITGNLGEARLHQGLYSEARTLCQTALAMALTCPGTEVFGSLQLLNLAGLARLQGDYQLARQLAEKGHRDLTGRLGEMHPHSVLALNNLAQVYAALGRQKQAIKAMERVKALALKVHGERHPLYSGAISNLGVAYYVQRRYKEAEPLLREALTLDEAAYGAAHPSITRGLSNLAALLDRTNRTDQAEVLLRRAINISRTLGRPDARAMASLGAIEFGRGRVDEAAQWFSEIREMVRAGVVRADPDLARQLEQFASVLRAMNRPADAERYQAEATRLRTKALIDTEALRALNYSAPWKGNRQ